MVVRIGLALGAMLLSYGGSALGSRLDTEWGEFLGALLGLAVGVVLMIAILRRIGRT